MNQQLVYGELEFDFLPHVICTNPKCNAMAPARSSFERNGDNYCSRRCAINHNLDRFVDEGYLK